MMLFLRFVRFHAAHCYLADCEYGLRLANALGLDVEILIELVNMTEEERLELASAEVW